MKSINKTLTVAALSFSLMSGLIFAADMDDTIIVSSTAFEHHGTVPLQFSAYGDNISPQLSWSNLPAGTAQLALVMDDPVAPTPQPFVHWVAYNIPADASGLPQALSKDPVVIDVPELVGMINGLNGTRQAGYFGPRPPVDGKLHAYHFRVYAIDSVLNLPEGLNKDALLEAIEGHVLGTGMLMGHYQQTE
ncbi:MAG: YbhB/YbcL family Raf kinase inhibitor-like protein [Gammaproteobacteria bacterium]|nr:YbhB/YbcL family Raf kinase inhibitor-like protein [Gammaproteobacteria bacterium]MDP2141177.1 YbhB/YbcL family Raf kinase inhibitor-like protein [Gammaproteobacteria bacterium]MDP2349149.1 YbhB/YbcL family Raf kinase inhibitor-like protein [Gammaproteobacteria bacterium]